MKIEMTRFGKPFDPNKKKKDKRKSHVRVILFLIIAIAIVSAVTIYIESVIKGYVITGQEATWTASLASYWGGIIGGMVSGVLAFLGVFYTIRYYKESDAQKERAAVQPVRGESCSDHCAEEGRRGNMERGGCKVGASEAPAVQPDPRQRAEAHPGGLCTGRRVCHQPGERRLACGLPAEQLVLRHGRDRREQQLQVPPREAVQVPDVDPAARQTSGRADRNACPEQPCGSLGAAVSAGRGAAPWT